MKRVVRYLAILFVTFFVLSLYSSLVMHVSQGGSVGSATKPLVFIARFPSLLRQVFQEKVQERRRMKKIKQDFKPINNLQSDVKVLRSYTTAEGGREVVLQNLKNNEVLRKWVLQDTFKDHNRVLNPMMMENGDIIYNIVKDVGLRRTDENGNNVWIAESNLIAHHSLNLDEDGNIWGCATKRTNGLIDPLAFRTFQKKGSVPYRDDLMVKWDSKTGKVLFKKSLTKLMLENKLTHLLFQQSGSLHDPFHLNDVQPVNINSKYFRKGDILASLRNSHTVIHYRPSNDSIIKLIRGPFVFQHDVDVIDSVTISVSNNNVYQRFNRKDVSSPLFNPQGDSSVFTITHSNVVTYNYETDSFSTLYENMFIKNKISTKTEGLSTILPNGDLFYEEQNQGVLWILNDSSVVYKHVFESYAEGFREHLNWTRVIVPES